MGVALFEVHFEAMHAQGGDGVHEGSCWGGDLGTNDEVEARGRMWVEVGEETIEQGDVGEDVIG